MLDNNIHINLPPIIHSALLKAEREERGSIEAQESGETRRDAGPLRTPAPRCATVRPPQNDAETCFWYMVLPSVG